MTMRFSTALIIASLTLCLIAPCSADLALRYKMTKGETLSYRCTLTGNGVIQAMGGVNPVSLGATFTYAIACTGVDEQGRMTLVNRVQDLAVQAVVAGQQLPVTADIPVLTTVIEPTGKIVSVQVERQEEGAGGVLGGNFTGGLTQKAALDVGQLFGEMHNPGFPVEPVHPGSRWEDSITMTTQAGQPMVLSYVTRFLDYALLNDRNCARLQTDYSLPLDLSLAAGFLFNFTGSHTGTQVAYFDYEAGHVLRYDGTADTQMTMANPQLFGAGGGNQVAATMTLRTGVTVVLDKVTTEEAGP